MASHRILKTHTQKSIFFYFLLLLSGILLINGCGASRKTSREPNNQPERSKTPDESSAEKSEAFLAVLNDNRSKLSDVYTTQQSEMPDFFKQESDTRDIGDPYDGYRIQILSTRNVTEADSIANDFRFWAETELENYIPEAYVLYRQPYYKVHIGNFQFHDQALKLNELIKKRYGDAWVVHDEVDPELVPADTVNFKKRNNGSVLSNGN